MDPIVNRDFYNTMKFIFPRGAREGDFHVDDQLISKKITIDKNHKIIGKIKNMQDIIRQW